MTKHIRHGSFKPGLIVHVLAVVVTAALLIQVAEQVEGFN